MNYDFQTALSQYGEAREQYRLLNLLHLFVQDFGSILAPMELTEAANPETDPSNFTSLRYCMRTNGRAGFVFINHYQRLATMAPLSHVILDTGIVRFPEISVDGDMAFFLPFHMEIADCLLEYATAQPLCRVAIHTFLLRSTEFLRNINLSAASGSGEPGIPFGLFNGGSPHCDADLGTGSQSP